MDEVTLGLLLAPTPPIRVVDAQVGKRRRSDDYDVVGDDAAVLERENVERAIELVRGKEQGNREPASLPVRRQRCGAREIVERELLHERKRSHHVVVAVAAAQSVGDERQQTRAEDRSQIDDERIECGPVMVGQASRRRRHHEGHYTDPTPCSFAL